MGPALAVGRLVTAANTIRAPFNPSQVPPARTSRGATITPIFHTPEGWPFGSGGRKTRPGSPPSRERSPRDTAMEDNQGAHKFAPLISGPLISLGGSHGPLFRIGVQVGRSDT